MLYLSSLSLNDYIDIQDYKLHIRIGVTFSASTLYTLFRQKIDKMALKRSPCIGEGQL